MMKKLNFYCIIYFLLLNVTESLSNSTPTNDYHHIDYLSIEKQSNRIAKELKYNKLLRYGINGSALCVGSYLVLRFLSPSHAANDIPIAPVGQFSIADVQNVTAMAQHYNTFQTKQKIGFMRTALLLGKEMAVAVTQQLLVITMFTGLNNSLGPLSKYIQYFDGIFTRTLEKIYHKGDLRWFVTTHTHCKQLLQELQEQSKCLLEGGSSVASVPSQATEALIVADENKKEISYISNDYHKKIIVDTWKIIVHDVEEILGFIQYKKSTIDKEYDFHESIQAIIDVIMQKTNEFSCHLHEVIQKTDNNELLSMSQTYNNFLEESLQSFIKFEPLLN